ncbi:MAG: flagellar hook assembly protein FlgD [Deltaproteobacteria bacterium]|nr:flagellar hook assembly protein FlgD [Deltaproteobacteria bacterium]
MSQDISSILGSTSGAASTAVAAAATDRTSLNKNQFLNLLLAQLKNQDPLNPSADPNQFTQQMTQFGQLEQLFNVNDTLKTMGTNQSNIASSDAVNMIGKRIEAKSNLIEVQSGVSSQIGISLPQPAASVKVDVVDTLGRVVRTVNYSNQSAGSAYYDFDGKDSTGAGLSGVYTLQISAQSANGTTIPAQGILQSTVGGVDYTSGTPMLRVGNRTINIGDVLSINQA